MDDNVIQFPEERMEFLANVSLLRAPDGSIHVAIYEMPPRIIEETGKEVPDRMRVIASWLGKGQVAVLKLANEFEDIVQDTHP